MALTTILTFSSLVASTSAWNYRSGYGAILEGNDTEAMILRQAAAQANSTASIPFTLNEHNLTLQVNISDLALPGVQTDIQNARAVLTTWDFTWPSNTTARDIFGGDSSSDESNYCVSTVGGMFSSSEVSEESVGVDSCVPAFGQDCVDALSSGLGDCGTPVSIPDACQKSFKNTDGIFTLGVSAQNASNSPFVVMARDTQIMTADDSSKQYQETAEQLQFLLVRGPEGSHSSIPLCARVMESASGLRLAPAYWLTASIVATAVFSII